MLHSGPSSLARKLHDPGAGVLRRAYVCVMVLGYSRHMFARIVFDQSTERSVTCWLGAEYAAHEVLLAGDGQPAGSEAARA